MWLNEYYNLKLCIWSDVMELTVQAAWNKLLTNSVCFPWCWSGRISLTLKHHYLFFLPHCRLFALKPPAFCLCVCILVTLLDTRTVPGELKWAASPSEGGVSGSSSSFTDTLFTSPFGKVTLSLAHTLAHSVWKLKRIIPQISKCAVVEQA